MTMTIGETQEEKRQNPIQYSTRTSAVMMTIITTTTAITITMTMIMTMILTMTTTSTMDGLG